ncbi:MAG TPA: NAD(P)-binding domain-containing protein [Acidimicrobiales bacterium]|nr:NAD(P)-binding domain-containing protein [Acidimicrobiales bacterium]
MEIAIIGTGFIGTTLGRALSKAGHQIRFGSRHPEDVASDSVGAPVAPIAEALSRSEVVILALPAAAVAGLAEEHGEALVGKLVIDATNRMGASETNSRTALPTGVRYARAFNPMSGENMAEPVFAEGQADMFFSAPEADQSVVESVIEGVGLRPIYVGQDQEELIDALF